MEDFKQRTGTQMQHIAYKGASVAASALLRGEITMLIVNMGNLDEHVKSGKIRILAAAGPQRASMRPDIPTISEAGVRGFDVITWYGLIGPARLPKVVIDKLNSGISSVLKSPDVRQPFAGMGLTIVDGTPTEFAARIGEEIEKWKRVIKPTWSSSR